MFIQLAKVYTVAGILMGIGAVILRLRRGSKTWRSSSVRFLARLLTVVGFFVVCLMFESFLSERETETFPLAFRLSSLLQLVG